MTTDLMNISAFKGMAPASAFAALDPHAESLADGIGSSYGIVGYKGKVWTLRHRGVTHQFLRPDDGTSAPFLDVIVLRSAPYKSKSYYPPGSFVDGQTGTRPLCAALNSESPDADILTPQATACAICPRNVFRTSPDGRKTRDCADYKRLAVLILPSQTKPLFGAPLMEPVFLRVPAASLNELALLGEGMQAQGFHYSSYITRIGFVLEKPHPQMTFRALQKLENQEAALVMPMRDDAVSIRITGENEVGKPRPAAMTNGTQEIAAGIAAQQAAAAQAAAIARKAEADALALAKAQAEAAAKAAAQTTAVDTGFGDVVGGVAPQQAAASNIVLPATAPAGVVDTGFGNGTASAPSLVQSADPVAMVVSDTGAPEEADADLDARVAALFPKLT